MSDYQVDNIFRELSGCDLREIVVDNVLGLSLTRKYCYVVRRGVPRRKLLDFLLDRVRDIESIVVFKAPWVFISGPSVGLIENNLQRAVFRHAMAAEDVENCCVFTFDEALSEFGLKVIESFLKQRVGGV